MVGDSGHRIEIETVAEVQRVEREIVIIALYPDERQVVISQSGAYQDYQAVSWPVEKTGEVIAALQRLLAEEMYRG